MQILDRASEVIKYSGADIALIIPTKDRPQKLDALLESLLNQTQLCGRILVIDGGVSVESVVLRYKNRLPIEYFACHPPGQIRQRNFGISKIDERTPLVGFIDDDLLFEPDAFEEILNFWNRAPLDTAGVGFNNVGVPKHRHSKFLAAFFMSSPTQGKIIKSGYNVSISNAADDIHTEWLGGGYTLWKLQILKQFPQAELNTSWAIGEDVRFSFPIGKKFPLFIAHAARFREQAEDYAAMTGNLYFRGKKSCLSYYFFVSMNAELSKLACFWMLIGKSLALILKGCFFINISMLSLGFGHLSSLGTILLSELGIANVKNALEG